jgi:sterol desaturase/sphingolipid hydroxylase (fatty acid hydroxylase superfamily)
MSSGVNASLPSVDSPAFMGFVAVAGITPYLFICGIYAYHFSARKTHPKLRKSDDEPTDEHKNEWMNALVRPEGITAVVGYMLGGLALSLAYPDVFGWVVPDSIQDLSLQVSPSSLIVHFLIFDSVMWCIHWCQHRFRWLYHNTHAVHHTIQSPTIICALTGYLPDTALLILVPLHITVSVAPWGNFATVFIFSVLSLLHLHCIHSEFQHSWDTTFRKWGIVNSWDHHVHHVKPRKNLAHFFVFLDKMMGTYEDPRTIERLVLK